jgi:PAS domain S-box-containing protein
VSNSATPHDAYPIDPSVPLESVLLTEELRRRPSRPSDFEKENRALAALARALVDSKTDILHILADKILDVTQCDSSGLTFLTKEDGGKSFYWPAVAGMWKPHTGRATPRDCGPSGDVLDRNCALLFQRFERRYTLFRSLTPPAEECLIVPFYIDGTAVGTMWALMHSDRRKFDAEDERIMTALGQFAAVAYQTLESLHDLKVQIAAREEAEKALRRLATGAEQQARSMVDTALDAVVLMNAEGVITEWNRQAEEIFGWKKDEAVGKRLSRTIIPEEYRTAHEQGLRHFLETGEAAVLNQRLEMTALRRNGQMFPVELTVTALNVSEYWSFHAFLRDITDRKRAEEALRASEQNLALIINSIPILAWSTRPDGAVDFFNRHFQNYTGLTLEEAQGWGWTVAVHPQDLPSLTTYWRSIILTGTPGEYEARFQRFDGVYRWFLIRAQPLRDESGEIVKWYGTNTDIEDRKQADEALRTTQARLTRAMQVATGGELSASIAHEINQPLAAVVASSHACLRFLSAQPPDLDSAREAAESIIRDGKDAGECVRRIRALFQRATVEKSMVNVNDVIGEVLRLLGGEIVKRSVMVETDLWENAPLVSGDRVQLQQLILNLLLNGMDAMDSVRDRPKRLWILSKPVGHVQVQIELRDNGVGLSDPDKVFEAFFTTKENGMGMGLAICRSIVEAHHGKLWVAPQEGPGATFCFTLPVTATAEL